MEASMWQGWPSKGRLMMRLGCGHYACTQVIAPIATFAQDAAFEVQASFTTPVQNKSYMDGSMAAASPKRADEDLAPPEQLRELAVGQVLAEDHVELRIHVGDAPQCGCSSRNVRPGLARECDKNTDWHVNCGSYGLRCFHCGRTSQRVC